MQTGSGDDARTWGEDNPHQPDAGQERAGATTALQGKRVVVVEDEGVTQMQLRRALSRAGLQVIGTAANGREGVETVLRERPDIVLMDIRMPVMDGIEATGKIIAEYPVCLLMLTAFSDEENKVRAQAAGASGYIVKPITGEMLIPVLEKAYTAFHSKTQP
jgi:AmiR/NasT family two-component response regulator